MAVQVFDKEGNLSYIEPEALRRHLDAGYVLDDPKKPKPSVKHPNTFYPASMTGIDKLPAKEAEKKVLAEMGIVEIVHPVSTPPFHVEPPPELQTKKKQTTVRKRKRA